MIGVFVEAALMFPVSIAVPSIFLERYDLFPHFNDYAV